MFVEYRYMYDRISHPDVTMVKFTPAYRLWEISINHDSCFPAAIRIRKKIHKILVLSMYEINRQEDFSTTREDKIDLKFKDGSIRTAEMLVTVNLSSRS